MKCIKTANGSIRRVKDSEARNLVFSEPENFSYCSKEEWKKWKKK